LFKAIRAIDLRGGCHSFGQDGQKECRYQQHAGDSDEKIDQREGTYWAGARRLHGVLMPIPYDMWCWQASLRNGVAPWGGFMFSSAIGLAG
jgi:hypothetical protein